MSIVSGIVNVIADTATGLKGALSDSAAKAITAAIETGGSLTEAITKNAPELLTNDTFMRVATKMGDSLSEIKKLEPSFHAGTGNVDDVLKTLDINATDDIAKGFSGLQDSITSAMKTTDGMVDGLADDLAGISRPTSPEGIRAQAAAASRAAAREAEEQAAKEAAEQAAREASEQAAKEAQEQAAKEAAEQAAQEAPKQAAKEGAEQSTKEGAEAAAKQKKPMSNLTKMGLSAVAAGVLLTGDTDLTPEERAAKEAAEAAAVDGKTIIGGKEFDVSSIPLHLMTDAEFDEYIATQQGPIDPEKMSALRQQALIDNGLGEVDANGIFQANAQKWQEARQKFDSALAGGQSISAATGAATPPPADTPKDGIGGFFEGIQDMFKQIVEMIQGFMKTLGAGGGLFGNLQGGINSAQAAQQSAATSTRQQSPSPTQAPTPQQPSLTPEQVAENALLQQHRGYAQGTHEAISAGSMSYAAMDTSKVKWDKDEIITGDADIDRIYQENIDGKFDGGTKGMLHMDEDEGLLYINKDANGDVTAYRVNDHINDIPNLNDLAWSQSSLDGFGNMMMANDRHTTGFNAQGGMVKTVEFDDGFFDGKDLKNEQLQFHAKLDSQGRYSVSVVNDAYKQSNGAALTAAEGQSNAEIAKEDPGFDYYVAGKDPIQERLYNEQQSSARNQKIADATGDGIRNAGKMIEGMIQNGMTVNIGNNNPTVSMGNRGPAFSATSAYDRMERDAQSQNRINGITID